MLPGQFPSSLLKNMTSPQNSVMIRGIFQQGAKSSITVSPIMMSNSYIFSFFVDEAMSKRLIVFPCDTTFVFENKNEDVKKIIGLLDRGMKYIHSSLMMERCIKFGKHGIKQRQHEFNHHKKAWNDFSGHSSDNKKKDRISDVSSVLPSVLMKNLIRNQVLELRDVKSVSRLEENTNTFFHLYTSMSLCAKAATNYGESSSSSATITEVEEDNSCDAEEQQLRRKKPANYESMCNKLPSPLQMCQINPKSLNTMAMNIARSRQGAWAQLNSMLNSVLFVEMPFVKTTRFFGRDFNIKMHSPATKNRPAINFDNCIGMSLPNPDMDVVGYDKEGELIGVGSSLTKHLCDAWGSMDVRDLMYSCHHLHMLFEMALQYTECKRRLSSLKTLKSDKTGVDYVAVMLACMVYQLMVSNLKYPVFLSSSSHKRANTEDIADENQVSSLSVPMFLAMVVNKPLHALRHSTNLALPNASQKSDHSDIVKYIVMNQWGLRLNPDYLCPNCVKHVL